MAWFHWTWSLPPLEMPSPEPMSIGVRFEKKLATVLVAVWSQLVTSKHGSVFWQIAMGYAKPLIMPLGSLMLLGFAFCRSWSQKTSPPSFWHSDTVVHEFRVPAIPCYSSVSLPIASAFKLFSLQNPAVGLEFQQLILQAQSLPTFHVPVIPVFLLNQPLGLSVRPLPVLQNLFQPDGGKLLCSLRHGMEPMLLAVNSSMTGPVLRKMNW